MNQHMIEPIATIRNNFTEKFGIPRQSNLSDVVSTIVFEKKYRDENAFKGLEEYSHIWLLWLFDKNNSDKKDWYPTVRPPRLGGNKRVGVFSTRSPYHPNGIGMSCVKLLSVEKDKDNGIIIKVSGADLLNGTPIIDIKPYLGFTDSHPEAVCGFSDIVKEHELNVIFDLENKDIDSSLKSEIVSILKQDPRPAYIENDNRVYSMKYGSFDIKFCVKDSCLTVTNIEELKG